MNDEAADPLLLQQLLERVTVSVHFGNQNILHGYRNWFNVSLIS